MIILVEFNKREFSLNELGTIPSLYVKYVKRMQNKDNADYLLCELLESIKISNEIITHLVIGGRIQGAPILKDITRLPINISLVINNQLIHEKYMDFSKGHFIGIGEATDITMQFNSTPKKNIFSLFKSKIKTLLRKSE